MKTIRKLRWMLALVLMAFTAHQAQAADYSYTHTSGTKTLTITTTSGSNFKVSGDNTTYSNIENITVSGGNLTITFNTTGIVHITGQIKVTKGTLTLQTGGSSVTYDHSHLKRRGGNDGKLIVVQNSTTTASSCKLVIKGSSAGNFSIHGNANWSTNYTNHTATLTSGGSESCLVYIEGGTLQLDYVSLTSNWNDKGHGGGLNVDANNSESKVTIDHCLFQYLYCHNSGAAMHIQVPLASNGNTSSIVMRNTTVQRNFAQSTDIATGGCIRSYGSNYCTMEVTDCTFQYNCSKKVVVHSIGMPVALLL